MSRLEGETIKKGDYSFVIICDIPDWNVWVRYKGKPLMVENTDIQVHKWMGDKMDINGAYLKNFINKFVNDENYRNEYITGKRKR